MLSVALASGCTTSLKSVGVHDFGKLAKGQVYYLPRAEYQVTVARLLKTCNRSFATDGEAAVAWLADQMRLVRSADPEDQVKVVQAIAKDPVLARGDVRHVFEVKLGQTWQQRLAPVPAEQTARGKRSKQAPQLQLPPDADDVLQAYIGKLESPSRPVPQLKFEAEIVADATASWVPDLAHSYTIDYDLMQSGLKGTDYTVETYPNGTLKSVNVTIDDQSGQAIQSVLSGAAKIAAAAGGFPLPTGKLEAGKAGDFLPFSEWKAIQEDANSPCKPDVRLKLLQRAGLEAQVQADAQTMLAQSKQIETLEKVRTKATVERDKAKAAAEAVDANDPKKAEMEAINKKAEADLKIAARAVLDAKDKLKETEEGAGKVAARLGALKTALTLKHSMTFRPVQDNRRGEVKGEKEAIRAWLEPGEIARCDSRPADCAALENAIGASVAVHAATSTAGTGTPTESTGVYYRQPVKAALMVCKGVPCVSEAGVVATPDAIVLNTPVDVPQLGALAVLPLVNKPFQNNTIGASFAESGALTKVTYKSNAAAAKAAEVFESSADSFLKFRDARRKQESSKLEASAAELDARKKLVDAQLALEKAQADLDKFRSSQSTTE